MLIVTCRADQCRIVWSYFHTIFRFRRYFFIPIQQIFTFILFKTDFLLLDFLKRFTFLKNRLSSILLLITFILQICRFVNLVNILNLLWVNFKFIIGLFATIINQLPCTISSIFFLLWIFIILSLGITNKYLIILILATSMNTEI